MVNGNGAKRTGAAWDYLIGETYEEILPSMPVAMDTFNFVVYKLATLEDMYRIGKAATQTKSTETQLTAIKLLQTLLEQCRELEIKESDLVDMLWKSTVKPRDDPNRSRDRMLKQQQQLVKKIIALVLEAADGIIDNKSHALRSFVDRQIDECLSKWSQAFPAEGGIKILMACFIKRLDNSYVFPDDFFKRWTDVHNDEYILEKTNWKKEAVKPISLMDVLGKYSNICPIFEE